MFRFRLSLPTLALALVGSLLLALAVVCRAGGPVGDGPAPAGPPVPAAQRPSADSLKIAGETKYKPHTLVRLAAEGVDDKAGILWRVYPREHVHPATNPRGVFEFAAPPGSYEVELLAITLDKAGALSIAEARTRVAIESCDHGPKPDPRPDPEKKGGKLDPPNAIGKITFGNAGCSATVIGPRRSDGRWDVLTAAHCISSVGQKGRMQMPASGRVHGVTVATLNRDSDIAWLVTDESVEEIEYANIARANPAVGTPVWHQGYGFDRPRNREDGVVTGNEDGNGQIRFTLNVSNGDSGGGIFRTDTNEVVSSVCCTTGIAQKVSMWGGSTAQALALRPSRTGEMSDWHPCPLPTRPAQEGAEEKPEDGSDAWTPTPLPLRPDALADKWTPVALPIRPEPKE